MEKLTPEMVLMAYRAGIFPMAAHRHSTEIRWYDPALRGVLPIAKLHVPKKLRQAVRKRPYRITFDRAFGQVIRACADTRPDTWINDEIIALYTALHEKGYAHSVEAWEGERLAGGLYGIALGSAFFGESMFSLSADASKIALVYLAARLWRQGFTLLDCQFVNEHLLQFGIEEIPRGEYRLRLKAALEKEAEFGRGQSPASGAGAAAAGLPSGDFSEENSCDFADTLLFLQSITQTS